MNFRLISGIMSGLLAFVAVSSAASLSTETQVGAYDADGNGLGTICYSASSNCSGTYDFADSVLTYTSFSSADYGVLKAAGSLSISRAPDAVGSGGPAQIAASGFSSFSDTWTIDGGPAGTTGHLVLQFDVNGTYGSSGVDTGLQYGLFLRTFTPFHDSSDNELPSYTGTVSTDFIFGTPFDFEVGLTAGASLYNLQNGGTNGQFSFLDESHTAVLRVAAVTDQNGTPIPLQLESASNSANYAALEGAATPEPGTFMLLTGAGGLFYAVRRRRQTGVA